MSIPITCPQCEKTLDVPDSAAGRRVKCRCGSVLPVPAADTSLDDERDADERPRRVRREQRRTSSRTMQSAWESLRLAMWVLGAVSAGVLGLMLKSAKPDSAFQQTGTACEIGAYAVVGFVLMYSADQVLRVLDRKSAAP